MTILITIGILLGSWLFMLATKSFMTLFFREKMTSPMRETASYALLFILMVVERFSLFVDFFYVPHIVVVGLSLFIITLNYRASVFKKIIVIVCNYVLFTIIVWLVGNLAGIFIILSNPAVNLFELPLDYMIWLSVLAGLFSYLFTLSLKVFKNIKNNNVKLPHTWAWISALFLQLFIVVVQFYISIPESWGLFYSFLINFSFLMIIVFFLYLYDAVSATHHEQIKSALYTQEKEFYLSQSQLMQESVEQLHSFKHDIRNHLTTLKDYTLNQNSKEALVYFDHLLGEVEKSEIYSKTGSIAFDSIINYKFRNAKQKDITLEIDLRFPRSIQIEAVDVVTILGNLLDNALEAVEQVSDKWIKLAIEFNSNCLLISIENPFDGEIDYSKEDRQIKTSKAEDGHGYGLKNVSNSVANYDGEMRVTHEDHVFSVLVFLYGDMA